MKVEEMRSRSRIAELEAKLKEREDHWRRVHERKIIEHDLRHEKSIAELKAERDRLREAIQPDDDCVLRKILLDVYGHTEGKEWKVMHRLKKALEKK